MKRILMAAVMAAALVVAPAATAAKPENPGSQGQGKSKRCAPSKVGFVVQGNNAVFTVTQNTDGTYDGEVTLTATQANKHARKSGVNDEDTAPETFQLDDAKIVGDPATVTPTDVVKLVGKIERSKRGGKKKPCEGFNADDRYGDPKIRKATINDAEETEPAPTA